MLKILTILLCCISSITSIAQLAPNPYIGAVYYYDFGQGINDPAFIGPPIPQDKTSLKYSDDLCPPAGYYTITSHTNFKSCYNTSWLEMPTDHTPYAQGSGMGMVFKADPNSFKSVVFVDTLDKQLCPGEVYQFSVAILNLILDGYCKNFNTNPEFLLRVESDKGITLANKLFTIPFWSNTIIPQPPPWWRSAPYSINFSVSPTVKRIVLKIILWQYTPDCADAFAIDDIAVTTVGPAIKIAFDNEPATTLIKSVCYQQNAQISMSGIMDAFYRNPELQWQVSSDSGKSWNDIPGANSNTYTQIFSTPDTFFFRLTGSDASLISNPNCRVASGLIEVNVDGPPSGYTINNNSPVCSGHDIKFSVLGNEANYVWTGPNGFYDNSPYPHIYHSSLADSGIYYVKIFSQGGCEKTDSTHIIVIGTDVHVSPLDTNICAGNKTQLHASDGIKYEWSPANTLSSSTVRDPFASPLQSTRYIVTVYDASGCSGSAGALIALKNKIPVKAVISANPYVCWPVDTISIINESKGDIAKTLWTFDNGSSSNVFNPPPQAYSVDLNRGNYTIRLVVTDSSGCSDTAYQVLQIESNCYIAVPNAFTPNYDGINDYLYPLNAYKATNLTFKVYNRLGQLMFQTNDWSKKWDGTFHGEPQPLGVYVWILQYTDEKNKRINLKGSTVLLR